MTSGKQSKAQRRTENQRRAAEKRAAELRQQRMRIGIRVGWRPGRRRARRRHHRGGDRRLHQRATAEPRSSCPAPAHPGIDVVDLGPTAQAEAPGPETVGVPSGPKLATLLTSATGQIVDGIQCQTNEQTVTHVHTHLTIFVNGKARVIPYGIGIPGAGAVSTSEGPFVQTGSCFYWLHVHANDGIIHIESPSTSESFTLGQFFDVWGIPLSKTQVGSATGNVTVFFTAPGEKTGIYTGNPRNLPLGDHYQIQLVVGTPIVAPVKVTDWGGL